MAHDDSIEYWAIIFFLIILILEYTIFFILNNQNLIDKKKSIKIINLSALNARFIYFFLGLLNTFIFLLVTIMITLYFYFLWLKFRYYNDYDILQQLNYYTLLIFSFLNYFLIFYDKIFWGFAFSTNIFVIGLAIAFFPYLHHKKKALNYRYRAIEELKKNNFDIGCKFLKLGIQNSKKMLERAIRVNPSYLSKLSRKMLSELRQLESSNSDKLNFETIFVIPKITKLDIRKYILWLTFFFLSFFFLFGIPLLFYFHVIKILYIPF